MTSVENKPPSVKDLKKTAKTVRMLVTSFGLGRGKTPSGRSLVTPKLRAPSKLLSSEKRTSPETMVGIPVTDAFTLEEVEKQFCKQQNKKQSPLKLTKPVSPLKLMQGKEEAMLNRAVSPLKFAQGNGEKMLKAASSQKMLPAEMNLPKRESPKKLTPALISPKVRKLETLRTPERGVGDDRLPVLAKREERTQYNKKPETHKNVIEKVIYVDIPQQKQSMISLAKKLSPSMISAKNRYERGTGEDKLPVLAKREPSLQRNYTHTPVVKSMKIMSYKPDAGCEGDKNGENAIDRLIKGDIDGSFEYFRKGCMHFDPQCRYDDPLIRKAFDAFRKRVIAIHTKLADSAYSLGEDLTSRWAFRAAWLANDGEEDDALINREYNKKYASKAGSPAKMTSPTKMVSPTLAPRMPARVSPSKVSPSKFGGVAKTGKNATVLPNEKFPMSHYDSSTAESKVNWENKVIAALNINDNDSAYELYYDEYTALNPTFDDSHDMHIVRACERAIDTLNKKLIVDNMRIAKEAYAKGNIDKALDYFTRNWLNRGGRDNEVEINREFQKAFRTENNNNKVSMAIAKGVKSVSPSWHNPSITQKERETLVVRRDEIINVLNDLMRNVEIDVTGEGSIKVLCGNVELAMGACRNVLDDSFEGKGRFNTKPGSEIVFNGVSIKFALSRDRKLKQQTGTYRGYKYHIDPVAGKWKYGINIGVADKNYNTHGEFEPMMYSDNELLETVKSHIDETLKTGSKSEPRQPQKMPSPKVKVQKSISPKKMLSPQMISSSEKKLSPQKMEPQRSKGHIVFSGDYELFLVGERVMKAPIQSVIDEYGFRLEKKLVTTKSEFEKRRQFFIDSCKTGAKIQSTKKVNEKSPVKPTVAKTLTPENVAVIEALNGQIQALTEEINKSKRQGIKVPDKVAEMNRLIMQRDMKTGVKKNFAPTANKQQRGK